MHDGHWSEQIPFVEPETKKRRGRPVGTPGGGRYGKKTKTVRVPLDVADNIDKILATFDDVRRLVDAWEDDAVARTSPRYDAAKKLLHELRSLLGD